MQRLLSCLKCSHVQSLWTGLLVGDNFLVLHVIQHLIGCALQSGQIAAGPAILPIHDCLLEALHSSFTAPTRPQLYNL